MPEYQYSLTSATSAGSRRAQALKMVWCKQCDLHDCWRPGLRRPYQVLMRYRQPSHVTTAPTVCRHVLGVLSSLIRHRVMVQAGAAAVRHQCTFSNFGTSFLFMPSLEQGKRPSAYGRARSSSLCPASMRARILRAMRRTAPGLSSSAARVRTLTTTHICAMAHSQCAATLCRPSLSATAQHLKTMSTSELWCSGSFCSKSKRWLTTATCAVPAHVR